MEWLVPNAALSNNSTPFSVTLWNFRWHWGCSKYELRYYINAICSVFVRKWKVPWNSMELGSMEKFPLNSMELWIWTKLHVIPWNHRCCSNVVQKVPWNSEESSMELFDQSKFQWALKRDFEWYFVTWWMPEMHIKYNANIDNKT